MTDLLLFTLFGPMASWGEEAVGEVRGSAIFPTRSAVLGLVAACLGIDRSDEERLLALERDLGLAILQHSEGVLLRDYHTVQMAEPLRGEVMHTRYDELRSGRIHTLLSQRDYRADAAWTAGIWSRSGGRVLLEEIALAMARPGFIPYLGRRACPLALPLDPRLLKVTDVLEALEALPSPLDGLKASDEGAPGLPVPPEVGGRRLAWEVGTPTQREGRFSEVVRRDGLRSRRRWQFDPRPERRGAASPPAGGEA